MFVQVNHILLGGMCSGMIANYERIDQGFTMGSSI